MSPAPVFGGDRPWSIASTVEAFYWTSSTDEYRNKRYEEHNVQAVVVALKKGGPEGWLVTLRDKDGGEFPGAPEFFNPAQIEALKPPCKR